MEYSREMIRMTHRLQTQKGMYALILLRAHTLSVSLCGNRIWMDGQYLLCLSEDDSLYVLAGQYEAISLFFLPYFYNVNLNHTVIGHSVYATMKALYGYPDFHLFRTRTETFCGILPLTEEEYHLALPYFRRAQMYIDSHDTDYMWSCRTRSEMISILNLAESVYNHTPIEREPEVITYIREHLAEPLSLNFLCDRFHTNRTSLNNLIKKHTGLPVMQYIIEERLNQSRPDLLFTWVPIAELAEKYGFSDVCYYIRAFRKRFGKTPHRYRQEGRTERIENETKYHLNENKSLSAEEFREALENGLGRAILCVRDHPDSHIYRQETIDFVGKSEEYIRPFGQYEIELIESFSEAEKLKNEVIDLLLKKIAGGKCFYTIRMLKQLGAGDRVEEVLEILYTSSYAAVLEYTKKYGNPTPHIACALEFTETAAAIVRLNPTNRIRIKKIFLDIADLFLIYDEPVVPGTYNPFYRILDTLGRKECFALLDEVAEEHPMGEKMHLKNELHFIPPLEENEIFTDEEILALIEEDSDIHMWDVSKHYKLVYSFSHASQETVRRTAECIVSEKDAGRQNTLLQLFIPFPYIKDEYTDPPLFPLEPSRLLAAVGVSDLSELTGAYTGKHEEIAPADVLRESLHFSRKYRNLESVLRVLSRVRHPDLRILAEKLYENTQCPFHIRTIGFAMWASNYEASDREKFTVYLLRDRDKPYNDAVGTETLSSSVLRTLIHHMKGYDKESLPLEVIPEIFPKIRSRRIRYDTLRFLKDMDALPEYLLEECCLDEDQKIRGLMENYKRNGDCDDD